MHAIRLASFLFAVPCLLSVRPQLVAQQPIPAPSSLAALQQFRQDHDGHWVVQWCAATGTPHTIYGTGLPLPGWRDNSLQAARGHAQQLLADRAELLGLGSSTFVETIGARMGRCWTFTFAQSFHGVPVIGGRADVRINLKGVVAMFGSRAWPIPADFGTVPTIDAAVAQAAAWATLEGEPNGPVAAPRLVIWGDVDSPQLAPFFLAWEVPVHAADAGGATVAGRWYIDAHTARALHFVDDQHECGVAGCGGSGGGAVPTVPAPPIPTTVTVMAWTQQSSDCYGPLVNVPLPRHQVDVSGLGTLLTDDNGQITIDIAAPVTVSLSSLAGPHLTGGLTGPNAPTASVPVQPGVAATLQLLSASALDSEYAHANAAFWIDRSNEWARAILGNTPQLAQADTLACEVNQTTSTCNAYYDVPQHLVRFLTSGGGCPNTAAPSIVMHEWGHALDQVYGGIANGSAEGLSEGWGDIVSMYQLDDPLLSIGLTTPGVAVRDGNNTRVWPYSGFYPHEAGQVWMGWAWKFREALRSSYGTTAAITLSNELVIGTIAANATTREGAVLEVFLADDDDGNLSNGTPHYTQLESASLQKGIPYPAYEPLHLAHTPLTNTGLSLVSRTVKAVAIANAGTLTQLRVVFDAGSGPVSRNMHPTGLPDEYEAMLPGRRIGAVRYRIEAASSTGASVTLPPTGDYLYAISSGTFGVPFFSEDFENGAPGWTHAATGGTDDWQVATPLGLNGSLGPISWTDPPAAWQGTHCAGTDLLNDGAYSPNSDRYLRSPVIDCTGKDGVRIRFRRWLSLQSTYDHALLLCNGQVVWQAPSGPALINDTAWQLVEFLVPWADDNPAVQFEWRMQSDAQIELGGWAIDMVQVAASVPSLLHAELRFLPAQASQGVPMSLEIDTPGNSRPFLVAVGDAFGVLSVPGYPPLFVGGNYGVLGGVTDATGHAQFPAMAPPVASAIGARFYSHVFTVNAAFTQFVTSNQQVVLITQTP